MWPPPGLWFKGLTDNVFKNQRLSEKSFSFGFAQGQDFGSGLPLGSRPTHRVFGDERDLCLLCLLRDIQQHAETRPRKVRKSAR